MMKVLIFMLCMIAMLSILHCIAITYTPKYSIHEETWSKCESNCMALSGVQGYGCGAPRCVRGGRRGTVREGRMEQCRKRSLRERSCGGRREW